MKIYTRQGDEGETGLFGGPRVAKDHARVEAYGSVDELNSLIGLAVSMEPAGFRDAELREIQRDLFALGGQLATPDPQKMAGQIQKANLAPERVAELEAIIDSIESALPPLKAFVIPGGCPKGAALHAARAACRRAERRVVTLNRLETVPQPVIAYLNRLSDLLFQLARLANQDAGWAELTW